MSIEGPKRLPIWRDTQLLILEIENAVRDFPRYHKYALGSDLRRQAMGLSRVLVRALNTQGAARQRQVARFIHATDDLKVLIQLAKSLKAFKNFAQFQRIAELAVNTSKQGGNWGRQLAERSARPVSEGHS